MGQYPTFRDWLLHKNPSYLESKSSSPDYSFDQWLKKVKDLGDDVTKIVDDAGKSEKDLDKKSRNAKKEPNKIPPDSEGDRDSEMESEDDGDLSDSEREDDGPDRQGPQRDKKSDRTASH